MNDQKKSVYATTWDKYVNEDFPRIQSEKPISRKKLKSWQVLNTRDDNYVWPGDEWGDSQTVQNILQTCVFNYLDAQPSILCELASGAGRITTQMIEKYPDAHIECFDISSAFLEKLRNRFNQRIRVNKLGTTLLNENPFLMFRTLRSLDMVRKVDCVYSFDAMVHVELHTLVIYIATATAVLKPGGILTMNVADASQDKGFLKLLANAPGVFRAGGQAGPQFQFTSPELIGKVLKSFGFSFEFHDCNQRDLFFTARLQDLYVAQASFKQAESNWWFPDEKNDSGQK